MKWYDYLKSTKSVSSGEDLADSVVLIVICLLVVFMVML